MFEQETTIEETKAFATGLYQGAQVVADSIKNGFNEVLDDLSQEWENLRQQRDMLSFNQINTLAVAKS